MEEKQRHPIIYNVYGGHNILAPNAVSASSLITKYHSPMDLRPKPFAEIDLTDKFFDSLRASYPGFDNWFRRKAAAGETAITYYEDDVLLDFLYLKEEREKVTDVHPHLPAKHRLKVGTFKIDSRGTRRGERLMKKLLDTAIARNVEEIYVTIFPEQRLQPLIRSFERFGFVQCGVKRHASGKEENVYLRDMRRMVGDTLKDYPFTDIRDNRFFQLSIMPEYHTRLFPDSILKNERKYDIIQDNSETNSIYKTYICWMKDTRQLRPGDKLVIYRTNDKKGPANYRSVCTSVCTVIEVKTIHDFANESDFVRYAHKQSVFTEYELCQWYRTKSNFILIQMVYNIAFTRKVILRDLREQVGLNPSYWGFFRLTTTQFNHILRLGEINERYLIR
ncbi:MAG: GNAT family N-acetyltransferase [Prevotella sp.]